MTVSVLVRLHEPCVAAGHSVGATVTVHCSGPAPRTPLAYVVAQVSGRWTSDPAWIRPDAHLSATDAAAGALDMHIHPHEAPWDAALDDANRIGGGGRPGYAGIIFRSAPLAVCIDEPVAEDLSTAFDVRCVLPDVLPATLRGTAVRYSYTFIVAAAMTGQTPKAMRVPFRVVTRGYDRVIPVPTPRRTGPSPSRFLEEVPAYALSMSSTLAKPQPPNDIEMALSVSANGRLTPFGSDDELWKNGKSLIEEDAPLNFMHYVPPSPRTPSFATNGLENGVPSSGGETEVTSLPMYQISRGSLSLARMYLPQRIHHLGDTLTASFDFRDAGTRCYRLNARLECQEIVQPSHALGTKHSSAGVHRIIFRKVFGEHGEFLAQNRNTSVSFSIPHDAPVSFATSAVHVRWLLHFVFLIPKEDEESLKNAVPSSASSSPPVHDDSSGAPASPDTEETTTLLANVAVNDAGEATESDKDASDVPGWEGGIWLGDDPSVWKRIPRAETDALQWTLPITVTHRHDSMWGNCAHSALQLTS